MSSEINDIRTAADFRTYSFSKFKKTVVCTQLIECMQKLRIEPACYWAAELVCAGHYADLWEVIFKYIGKHIHLGNPKIVKYIEIRYEVFRTIMHKGHFTSELQLRNNHTIRKLFAEIIAVVTYSNRKHSFEPIKIKREEEFDITQMQERLIAPSTEYVDSIFRKEDPKELYIAINEFAYNISPERRNMMKACYWIEWTIEFDLICKKRKEPISCERRAEASGADNKYQHDVIWIIWEVLVNQSHENRNPFIISIMQSLLTIFSVKYTTAAAKKRRYLLYFAVALLTEPVPTTIDMIGNKSVVEQVVAKIDDIYVQIKKNEESPNMEYLFSNLEHEANLEKSIRQIEMMNSMGIMPSINQTDG